MNRSQVLFLKSLPHLAECSHCAESWLFGCSVLVFVTAHSIRCLAFICVLFWRSSCCLLCNFIFPFWTVPSATPPHPASSDAREVSVSRHLRVKHYHRRAAPAHILSWPPLGLVHKQWHHPPPLPKLKLLGTWRKSQESLSSPRGHTIPRETL